MGDFRSSRWPLRQEQGIEIQRDARIWITNTFNLSGAFKFGNGSPTPTNWYAPTEQGIYAPTINGSIAYQRFDARVLTTGSLYREL